nr:unnamed protein product [Digitaria exilis]
MAILNLGGGCGGGGGDDKENAPPSTARGVAVKSHTAMKKKPGLGSRATRRRRPPLRDITNLFVSAQCQSPATAEPALAGTETEVAVAVAVAETVRADASATGGVTLKQGRYSLVKGFRI